MSRSPGYRALRTGRVSQPGRVYLLTTVTADRRPWFLDTSLARAACRAMIAPATWGDARPLCWVVMPDHWHGLVALGTHDDLATVMRRCKAAVSRLVHPLRPEARLWADGYHDRALRREDDLRAAARYLIANPVRAGLVKRAADYPYWHCIWL